jgi:hypothetical protein
LTERASLQNEKWAIRIFYESAYEGRSVPAWQTR